MKRKKPDAAYPVGYGKPPAHTRFQNGVSGNPGGRPRGMTTGRAAALMLKEAYRPVTVREGDRVYTLPAFQVVLRSQLTLAAKGNGPAQRAVVKNLQSIEHELATQTGNHAQTKLIISWRDPMPSIGQTAGGAADTQGEKLEHLETFEE